MKMLFLSCRMRPLNGLFFWRWAAVAALILIFSILPGGAAAQNGQPEGPIYIVQPGDTLFIIASQFGVTIEDIIAANAITNPNTLSVGDQLVIPGLPGIRGVLTTETVAYGETLTSIGRQYEIPVDTLARLNRLVSPVELYAGSSVILPIQEIERARFGRVLLTPGISVLELAVAETANPWQVLIRNQLQSSHQGIPGDVLRSSAPEDAGPGALPPQITRVEITTLPLISGGDGDD